MLETTEIIKRLESQKQQLERQSLNATAKLASMEQKVSTSDFLLQNKNSPFTVDIVDSVNKNAAFKNVVKGTTFTAKIVKSPVKIGDNPVALDYRNPFILEVKGGDIVEKVSLSTTSKLSNWLMRFVILGVLVPDVTEFSLNFSSIENKETGETNSRFLIPDEKSFNELRTKAIAKVVEVNPQLETLFA